MHKSATSRVRRTKHAIIAAVALSLGAFAAAPTKAATVISSEGVTGRYSHSEYSAAVDGKEFRVEVRGMPFAGVSQPAFDQALVNVLNAARPSHPATEFTVHPTAGKADRSYRLVVVFAPSQGASFQSQCQIPDAARFDAMPAGRVEVSVAFCRNDEVLSHAVASTTAADINDPAFRMMFADVLRVLFPLDNPLLYGGS